jgi:16S rRNA processing protein RimM
MNVTTVAPDEDLISVAKAVKTRGLRGELVAEMLTDFPERFQGLENLYALAPGGERLTVTLQSHWFQRDRVVLKFSGYDSIEASSALIGYEFAIPESQRVPLPEDQYYDWELEGCLVEKVDGQTLGPVREIMRTGGVEMLVVERAAEAGRESGSYLIPLAAAICVEVDVEHKRIRIDPPEGLLEF